MLAKIRFFAATLLVLLPLGHFASATVGFKPAQSYAVGTAPEMAAVADFNNDGKPDIAVVCFGDPSVGDDGGVSIFLGDGDGTFQTPLQYDVGASADYVAIADFNGDSKLDLLASSGGSVGTVGILLGNGDATFQPALITSVPASNYFDAVSPYVAVGNFNGDGHLISTRLRARQQYEVFAPATTHLINTRSVNSRDPFCRWLARY